jgi:hypothetical protein
MYALIHKVFSLRVLHVLPSCTFVPAGSDSHFVVSLGRLVNPGDYRVDGEALYDHDARHAQGSPPQWADIRCPCALPSSLGHLSTHGLVVGPAGQSSYGPLLVGKPQHGGWRRGPLHIRSSFMQ